MKLIKKIIKKIKFRIELNMMDYIYYITDGNGFSMFPPSFYYTHTQEEIERIRNEQLEEMQKIIDKKKSEINAKQVSQDNC